MKDTVSNNFKKFMVLFFRLRLFFLLLTFVREPKVILTSSFLGLESNRLGNIN